MLNYNTYTYETTFKFTDWHLCIIQIRMLKNISDHVNSAAHTPSLPRFFWGSLSLLSCTTCVRPYVVRPVTITSTLQLSHQPCWVLFT